MHIILTGATGLVGGACLHSLLRNPHITKISILTRQPSIQLLTNSPPLDIDKKCTIILHRDFAQPPPPNVLTLLQGAKGCIWALGVSVNDVSKAEYKLITVDYPLNFARAFARAFLTPFNFVYVSGEGATTSPGYTTPRFGRVKGAAELALLALPREDGCGYLRVFAARPDMVDATGHAELQQAVMMRPTPLWKRVSERPLLVLLRATWKGMVSPTMDLGDVLVALATGDGARAEEGPGVQGEGRILSNVALRRMVGS